MPIPDISRRDIPVGPMRDKIVMTLGNDDYELPSGFICQMVGTGDVNYRTLEGNSDQTENIPTSGVIIGVGNHPVLLSAVRGHSNGTDNTITQLIIGRI